MILVRKDSLGIIEEFELEEFEEKVRRGHISPHMEVCFPVVTGDRFVTAKDLELYQGLYNTDALNFKRYFHLGRIPWLTMTLIALLCAVHFWWPEAPGRTADRLLQRGAKSLPLMLELGQWWRLVTANFIHVSGWHLLVNCLFLFNLGGPAEAIFRRLDYILILVATAVGGTLLSTLVNPAVSCGASGIVFGVWGASATFGVRYRHMLPKRYRRYFIGSVIPYSIFALYMGIAMPGIDNWGHLGGLVIGSALACILPARMLRPQDPWAISKLLAMAVVALLIALGSQFAAGSGDLIRNHYYPRNGLIVAVPQDWLTLVEEREISTENYAYHNEASVVIAFETREVRQPGDLESFTREFLELDFADQLEIHNARGLRVQDPSDVVIAGYPAKKINADIVTPRTASTASYFLITRGNYRYIISFSAPIWLRESYEPLLGAIIGNIEISDPARLITAREKFAESESPKTQADLGLALCYAGLCGEGKGLLGDAIKKWPKAGEPYSALARILYENREQLPQACRLIRHALQHQTLKAELMMLAVTLHEKCGEKQRAHKLLKAAIKRFPQDRALKLRARKVNLEGLDELLESLKKPSKPLPQNPN